MQRAPATNHLFLITARNLFPEAPLVTPNRRNIYFVRNRYFSSSLTPAIRRVIGKASSGIHRVEMEVTRHNFDESMPAVRQALADCSFFAIDCEMTGLFVKDNTNGRDRKAPVFLDDIEDRYEEMLASSKAFVITQFGLSAFIWDGSASAWRPKTFNFYTFPRPFEDWQPRFLCEAASMDFLAGCNFDFNKWVHGGIAYMPVSVRNAKLAALDRARSRPDIIVSKGDDVKFVNSTVTAVTEWLAAAADTPLSQVKPLELPPVNAYQRALQYQTLRKNTFCPSDPPGFTVNRIENDEGRAVLRLERATSEEVKIFENEQRVKREQGIRAAAAFTAVLDAMRDSKKPVIGHNLSFDVAYTLNSFAKPLPPTWLEYKDFVRRYFPGGVYDTKYIARQFPEAFPETGLGDLYNQVVLSLAAEKKNINKVEVVMTEGEDPARIQGVQDDGAALALAIALGGTIPVVGTANGTIGSGTTTEIITPMEADFEIDSGGQIGVDVTMKQSSQDEGTINGASTAAAAAAVGVGSTMITTSSGSTILEAAFPGAVLSQLPPVDHADGFDRYRGVADVASYAHEAGYDAYMTGAVFSRLVALLGSSSTSGTGTIDGTTGDLPTEISFRFNLPTEAPRLDPVDEYCWRANISRSDLEYAALFGDDPVPPRHNVLYLTNLDPFSYRHSGELYRKLNLNIQNLGGQVRVTILGDDGAAALVELPTQDPEVIAETAAAVRAALPKCIVRDFDAFRTVKAMQKAGILEEKEIEQGAPSRAKRPRTATPDEGREEARDWGRVGEWARAVDIRERAGEWARNVELPERCSIM